MFDGGMNMTNSLKDCPLFSGHKKNFRQYISQLVGFFRAQDALQDWVLLFLYGRGTIKTDGSPDEHSQFGALGDIGKDALRLVSRVKLEPEHGGDEMTVAELQAMSKDELVQHMLAGAPPHRYQDMEAVVFKDIFATERHPAVVITN